MDSPNEATPAWFQLLEKAPGFLSGFILGIISGYFGNWAWEKFKPRKKDTHLSIEVGESGTYFSGMFKRSDQDRIYKVLQAASKPQNKATSYKKPKDGIST